MALQAFAGESHQLGRGLQIPVRLAGIYVTQVVRARTINEDMKLAAAHAIARVIPDDELLADYIIPTVFNRHVAESVAEAVADAAVSTGVARRARRGQAHEPATPLEAMR